VFDAIEAGCAAMWVNPGNIKAFDDKVGGDRSLDKRLMAKYAKATPEALVESGRSSSRSCCTASAQASTDGGRSSIDVRTVGRRSHPGLCRLDYSNKEARLNRI
jgi:hypothetical protein